MARPIDSLRTEILQLKQARRNQLSSWQNEFSGLSTPSATATPPISGTVKIEVKGETREGIQDQDIFASVHIIEEKLSDARSSTIKAEETVQVLEEVSYQGSFGHKSDSLATVATLTKSEFMASKRKTSEALSDDEGGQAGIGNEPRSGTDKINKLLRYSIPDKQTKMRPKTNLQAKTRFRHTKAMHQMRENPKGASVNFTSDQSGDEDEDDILCHEEVSSITKGSVSKKKKPPQTEAELKERLKDVEQNYKATRKLRTEERKQITALKEKGKAYTAEIAKLKQDVKDANEALASQVIEHSTKEKSLKKELQQQNTQLSRALQAHKAPTAPLDQIVPNRLHAQKLVELTINHENALSSLKKDHVLETGSLKAQLTTETTKSARAEKEILKLRTDLHEAQEKLARSETAAIQAMLAEKEKDVANLRKLLSGETQQQPDLLESPYLSSVPRPVVRRVQDPQLPKVERKQSP